MKLTVNGTVTVVKYAISGIVGLGTTKIVRTIIDNNVEPETTKDQVTVGAASIVVGMMAADATKSYSDAMIDGLVETINTMRAAKTSNIIEED